MIKKPYLFFISYSLALFLFTFLMWWKWCPELMNYQEQFQLFLWTDTYFLNRINTIGGLADYISEFFVQFFYIPLFGALLIAAIITILQILIALLIINKRDTLKFKICAYILSGLPSLMIIHSLGDENMLWSFTIALILACTTCFIISCTEKMNIWWFGVCILFGFFILYWLTGPVAIIFPLISILQQTNLKYKWIWILASITGSIIIIQYLAHTLFIQYPESQLFYGINYYRIENLHPIELLLICIVILTLIIFTPSLRRLSMNISWTSIGLILITIIIGGSLYVKSGYDENKLEIFRYDSLTRQGKWFDIINMAQRKKPHNDICLQAVNLALAKTGQLGERMFEFPQEGMKSLMSKYSRDNTSCLVSAEAFYHLAMVNSAFRYNFDLQEAIMNNRKSGRFTKRMAECLIINGKFKAAKKYVDMLKHSLYYKKWANEASLLMKDDSTIDKHNDYGEKRRNRFKQELLYDYEELDKIIGLLALESNGHNRLAWDYFNGALLLKCDLSTFTGMYHYNNEMFNQSEIPVHHQEAIAMSWTMGHPDFEELPYPISKAVKQRFISLAHTYQMNQHQISAWISQYDSTYWAYFLSHQTNLQKENTSPIEREG